MIIIKNKLAIEKMRMAGKLLSQVFEKLSDIVVSGKNTLEIDTFIEKKIKSLGLRSECKGYAGYNYVSCISLNDVVVHGIPSRKIVLKSGDFVKIDIVASYKGYCADMARYFFVGQVSSLVKRLAMTAQRALDTAIDKAFPGRQLSEISVCIQQVVEAEGFGVVREFAGHGIGKDMHEDPEVPNFGEPGKGPILREGMTFAIEPMITERGYDVRVMADGWAVQTIDGGFAAHVEDTIVVMRDGAEILTRSV